MIIIGLTGLIGVGKSTVSTMVRRSHIPVFDADAEVQKLFHDGKVIDELVEAFGIEIISEGCVDKSVIFKKCFMFNEKRDELDNIFHPRVKMSMDRFIKINRSRRERIVVLDIPLLFETGLNEKVDYVITITSPKFLQQMRVLRRPGMTLEKFKVVVKNQFPNTVKIRGSDCVIRNGLNKGYIRSKVLRFLNNILVER